MSTRVLIIGASARAAAESASRAGWDVVASDMFGDVDLKRISEFVPIKDYPEDFVGVVEHHPLPVIYTGGLENHPEVFENAGVVWGNRTESVEKVRDPVWWSGLLSKAGFRVPQLAREVNQKSRAAFLSKPLKGAGGTGVSLADQSRPPEGRYFQEMIFGRSMGAVFVAAKRQAWLCGVTECLAWRSQAEAGFPYGGSLGPVRVSDSVEAQLRKIGGLLAAEADLRGLFGVDFVLHDQDGAIPIEINPRYTASVEVLELATGISLLDAHRHACTRNELIRAESQQHASVAKVVLYARDQITVGGDFGRQVLPDGVRMADIPSAGTIVEATHPLCTLLATGSTIDKALARLAGTPQLVHSNASSAVDVLS